MKKENLVREYGEKRTALFRVVSYAFDGPVDHVYTRQAWYFSTLLTAQDLFQKEIERTTRQNYVVFIQTGKWIMTNWISDRIILITKNQYIGFRK